MPDSIGPSGHWAVEVAANAGNMLHGDPDIQQILHTYHVNHYEIKASWQANEDSETPFDHSLNLPELQAGILYSDFSHLDISRPQTPYTSRIGHILTLYGGARLNLYRLHRWNLDFSLQHGIGYCPNPFDEHTNNDNLIIGSPLSIYVAGGIHLGYDISRQWKLSVGAEFKHYSNGTLDRPNLGANTVGPTISLKYGLQTYPQTSLNEEEVESPPLSEGDRRKFFYVETIAGLGMKALIDRFNVYHTSYNPVYGFPTFLVTPMYRYHLLHATGIGIDYTYADYVYKIKEYDHIKKKEAGQKYSPHILGFSLRQELFYRHLSLNGAVGIYALKNTGYISTINESSVYQHIGLRYNTPFTNERLFIGYIIKAHKFSKVDCVQIHLGYRFGKVAKY